MQNWKLENGKIVTKEFAKNMHEMCFGNEKAANFTAIEKFWQT